MSSEPIQRGARDEVSVFLMGGEEADAVMEQLREKDVPGLKIRSADVYWEIEAPNRIDIDLVDLSERLGREVSISEFLVILATYFGRIDIEENRFSVVTELIGTGRADESQTAR